ncbi:putative 26S proteasome non-atpase regulatory subunit Rpn6 [Atractiella rhizophila]|nr:putative 26S proteasome non-atpase regulatory subunit Rpn6 [Atractiella rhizophila]
MAGTNVPSDPAAAESHYQNILSSDPEWTDAAISKEKEDALLALGQLYRDQNRVQDLASLVRNSRNFIKSSSKAKSAKLVRNLVDLFGGIKGDGMKVQIEVTKEVVAWAKEERRIFLKHNLEIRLVSLYLESSAYREALTLINALLKELKRLDDKMILTEVHLLESKVHYSLVNFSKSKAALTSARTAANAIYCPPLLQAELDLQSGILHSQDKDYKTAYSYFFESLEGFSSQDSPLAVNALKYMLLCKVMLNLPEDVSSIVTSKLALRYTGSDVDALKAVAAAHKNRNLSEFQAATQKYRKELLDDAMVKNHLGGLYDTLLEQNLVRIVEPYSRVEILHVAETIGQPVREVEAKLSQMILDKVFYGVIDQGEGCLIVYDEPEEDETYDATLETLKNVSTVVDNLHAKALKLR